MRLHGGSLRGERGDVVLDEPGIDVEITSGFVGMFDFLGYASMLSFSGPLPQVQLQAYEIETRLLLRFAAMRMDAQNPEYSVLRFADTFVIWTETDDTDALSAIITAGSTLLATSLGRGLPIRGGIARGDLCVNRDEELVLGAPVARAHHLETSQDWVGAVLDPMVSDDEAWQEAVAELVGESLLREIECPLIESKAGPRTMRCHALEWPRHLDSTVEELRRRLVEVGPQDERRRSRRERAVEFFERSRNRPSRHAEASPEAVHFLHPSGPRATLRFDPRMLAEASGTTGAGSAGGRGITF